MTNMEIHARHGQVQSLRDVAVHLAIVTIGILIALGLEQAVEWSPARTEPNRRATLSGNAVSQPHSLRDMLEATWEGSNLIVPKLL